MGPVWRIEMLGWLRAVPGSAGVGSAATPAMARFRSRKTAALVAYLAYYPERSHPRELLIELLWPDAPWHAGRTSLRTELSWLRRRLEPPGVPAGAVLITDGDTVWLNPTACATDVAGFETALRSADEAGAGAARIRWLTEAVERYRGELLPGLGDAWVVPERLRLAHAYLAAAHELVEHRQRAGDLPGALRLAWRAATVDPHREETHADLVRLLGLTGREDAALSGSRDREQLRPPGLNGRTNLDSGILFSAPEHAVRQSGRKPAVGAGELRRQLALRAAEAEDLRQRLLAEMAETQKLRQELVARAAEAEELRRRLAPEPADLPEERPR